MRTAKKNRGQFVIIAVLLAAIMIVSIGTLMHTATTYYKHEPWEEYSTLIGNIELNSLRLVELSLSDYSNSAVQDPLMLSENLEKWQNNLTGIYPSKGILLKPDLSNGGLSCLGWNTKTASSQAAANFELDITSIGLAGYKFSTKISLSLSSLGFNSTSKEIGALVTSESGKAVLGLKRNFRVNNVTATSVLQIPNSNGVITYRIPYNGTLPAEVEVWDQRGIRVVANCSESFA